MRRAKHSLTIVMLSLMMLSTSFVLVQGTKECNFQGSAINIHETGTDAFGTVSEGFIRNMGQWDDEVLYAMKGDRMISYFTVSGVSHDLKTETGGYVLGIEFDHASGMAPAGVNELDHRLNFFTGNDPARWAKEVKCYNRILYEDVWPGVDILYYTRDHELKYDVILDEFAAPEDVMFTVEGVIGISTNGDALEMELSDSISLRDMDLTAFYEDGEEVVIGFREIDRYSYGFDVDKEPGRRMVIDPVLFSTSIGGSGLDSVYDLEVDEAGYHYICGNTMSVDFPNTTGAYDNYPGDPPGDVFVSKFNRNGSALIFSSFLGGWTYDCAGGMDMDENGSIYLAGWTYGWEFPTTPGAFMENYSGPSAIFVTKLSANGSSLEYSTFVCSESIDFGYDVTEIDGQACVVGYTFGHQFPTPWGFGGGVHGLGIVFILSRDGSSIIDFAGIDGYYGEYMTKVMKNAKGELVIAGTTASSDFHTTSHSVQFTFSPGNNNAFLTKYTPFSGMFDFISMIGRITVNGLNIDSNDDIYLTGNVMQDGSIKFPYTEGSIYSRVNGSRDAFVMKISGDGKRLFFTSLIGGPLRDEGGDIEIDHAGNIYLVGQTTDLSNLTDLGGIPPGGRDGFIMKLDGNCSTILNLTYIGGSGEDGIWHSYLRNNNDIVVCGMESSVDLDLSNEFNRSDTFSIFTMGLSIRSPPSGPIDLVAEEGDACIDLTWLPPIDDGRSMITNYSVYRGDRPDNLSMLRIVGNLTSFQDKDTELGKPYFYAVSAVNALGEGSFSNVEGNISTTLPSPPSSFEVEAAMRSVIVSFGPPVSSGGTGITLYSIYRDGEHLGDVVPDRFSYIDRDIGMGEVHEYSVSSWNRKGESDRTGPIAVTTKDCPSPPRDLECIQGGEYLEIRWREPANSGGLDIENYMIFRGSEDDDPAILKIVTFDTISYRDDRVSVGVEYFYSVQALNKLGLSEPSNTVSGIFSGFPGPPVQVAASPGLNSIELCWSPPPNTAEGVIKFHAIYHGPSPEDLVLIDLVDGGSRSYRHSGLVQNGLHYYRITSVTDLGESVPSPVVYQRPILAPTPPGDLKAYGLPGSVLLEWGNPTSSGNSPLTGFTVFRAHAGSTLVQYAGINGSSRTFTDVNVERGVEYRYAIGSLNGYAASGPGESVGAQGTFVPDPPPSVSATLTGETISVAWTGPDYDGGSNITSYRVVRQDPSGIQVLIGSVMPGTFTVVDITALRGRTYSYHVIAANIIGPSGPSEKATVRLGDVPSAPFGLVAMEFGGRIALTWSVLPDPHADNITGYNIFRMEDGGGYEMIAILGHDAGIFIDGDAEPGTSYEYRVSAVNMFGESQPSEPVLIDVSELENKRDDMAHLYLYMSVIAGTILVLLVLLNLILIMRRGRMMGGEE